MIEEKLKALLEHCGFTVLVQLMEISARQERWISSIGQKRVDSYVKYRSKLKVENTSVMLFDNDTST